MHRFAALPEAHCQRARRASGPEDQDAVDVFESADGEEEAVGIGVVADQPAVFIDEGVHDADLPGETAYLVAGVESRFLVRHGDIGTAQTEFEERFFELTAVLQADPRIAGRIAERPEDVVMHQRGA